MYRFQPSINPPQNWEVPRIYLGFTPLRRLPWLAEKVHHEWVDGHVIVFQGWILTKSLQLAGGWRQRLPGLEAAYLQGTQSVGFPGHLAPCRHEGGLVSLVTGPNWTNKKRSYCSPCFFVVTSINEMNWNESYLFDSWRKLKTLGFP